MERVFDQMGIREHVKMNDIFRLRSKGTTGGPWLTRVQVTRIQVARHFN